MTQKILFSLVIGIFVAALAGAAAADYSMEGSTPHGAVVRPSESPTDPELTLGQEDSWQAREPVETGAMPERPRSPSGSLCCTGGEGLTFEPNGSAEIRPGIDDGQ